MRATVLFAALLAALPGLALSGGIPSWTYRVSDRAHGPYSWRGQCATGRRQSPVNVVDASGPDAALTELLFRYDSAEPRVTNDGRIVSLEFPRGSTMLAPGGETVELVRVEFHSPSEHRVRGITFPLEMQLYHRRRKGGAAKKAAGRGGLVAVSQLFTEGGASGPLSKLLDPRLRPIPEDEGASPALLRGVFLNAANALARERHYFAYRGSLTRPPCTEGVDWYVMGDYASVSLDQVTYLQNAIARVAARAAAAAASAKEDDGGDASGASSADAEEAVARLNSIEGFGRAGAIGYSGIADAVNGGGNARPVQNWNGRRVRASRVPPTRVPQGDLSKGKGAEERGDAAAQRAKGQAAEIVRESGISSEDTRGKTADQVLAEARGRLKDIAEEKKLKAEAKKN